MTLKQYEYGNKLDFMDGLRRANWEGLKEDLVEDISQNDDVVTLSETVTKHSKEHKEELHLASPEHRMQPEKKQVVHPKETHEPPSHITHPIVESQLTPH